MMPNVGSLLTLSYYGAEKVIPNYNVMGLCKAALEASVKYLACDLGPHKILGKQSPLRRNTTIEDIGKSSIVLAK
ncbi:unnamed protein product [Ceratitis capitata]|uniref:(Mediterranean fruit fly) hypothetical protein n=1 Tax=Ceratitis capitata TaxID=7213 RepID=A0A811UNT4_CERCA|nr:unnamed protein product [Ceratitis capitata]